jgi:hypothetical protein
MKRRNFFAMLFGAPMAATAKTDKTPVSVKAEFIIKGSDLVILLKRNERRERLGL